MQGRYHHLKQQDFQGIKTVNEILLECKNHFLILDEQEIRNEGDRENDNKLEPGLIQVIGKAIAQHYRVKKRAI
jgi:hypothetical protein